jgi:hypothetical protein
VERKKKSRKKREVVGFLGVGLDNQDGEHRITRNEHFLLIGGSDETHGQMQDTAIKFTDALHNRGKTLADASFQEVIDLFREVRPG